MQIWVQAPATMAMWSWAQVLVELNPTPFRWDAHLGHCSSNALHHPSMQQQKEGAAGNRMLALLCAAL